MSKKKSRRPRPAKDRTQREQLFEASEKLAQAEGFRTAKDLKRAQRLCEDLLKQYPDYVGALHTLGQVLFDLENYEKAFVHLSKANAICPGNWQILTILGRTKMNLGMAESALGDLETARVIEPRNPTVLESLASSYHHEGELENAMACLEALVEVKPEDPRPRLMLASCAAILGRTDRTLALCDALIAEGHMNTGILTELSNLPAVVVSHDLLALAEKISSNDIAETHDLAYAKALSLHHAGRFDEAWNQLIKANAEKRKRAIVTWESEITARERVLECARKTPAFRASTAQPDSAPLSLFILGASRSGKTTLERLVGALRDVKMGYENAIIDKAFNRTVWMSRCIGVSTFDALPEELYPDFRNAYSKVLIEKADGAAIFTNTLPGLAEKALYLRLIIPNCRFVFIKRNREDQILRILMMNYRAAPDDFPYAYDVKTINEYLDWYYALADICVEKMPNECRIIDYEDMVEDPGSALQIVCTLCGVEEFPAELPQRGDDRGVANPYRTLIQAALEAKP